MRNKTLSKRPHILNTKLKSQLSISKKKNLGKSPGPEETKENDKNESMNRDKSIDNLLDNPDLQGFQDRNIERVTPDLLHNLINFLNKDQASSKPH